MIAAVFLFIVLAVAALIYANAARRQVPDPNMRRELAWCFMVAAVIWLVYVLTAWVSANSGARLPSPFR